MNWLNGSTQRAVVNGTTSGWWPVTSSISQGSILEPGLFNTVIRDLDAGVEGIPSKFADNTDVALWRDKRLMEGSR